MRDARAGYRQTLDVLKFAKQHRPDVLTKSSLMVGLGETDDEIVAALDDLKQSAVDIVTFGQYLRPTPNHLTVERYVTPEQFERYRKQGLGRGFLAGAGRQQDGHREADGEEGTKVHGGSLFG